MTKAAEYTARYRAKHPDRVAASKAKAKAEHPEREAQYQARYRSKNHEKTKAAMARWAAANKERRREYMAKRYAENREQSLAARAEWGKQNPGQVLANALLCRARKKAVAIGDHVAVAVFAEIVSTEPTMFCFYCERPLPKNERQVDHVTPLARGGAHQVENLVCACRKCNRAKGQKEVEVFFRSMKRA